MSLSQLELPCSSCDNRARAAIAPFAAAAAARRKRSAKRDIVVPALLHGTEGVHDGYRREIGGTCVVPDLRSDPE